MVFGLRWSVIAGTGAVLLAACGGGVGSSPSAGDSATPGATPTPAQSAPGSTLPSAPPAIGLADLHPLEIQLSGGPDWPTELGGSVWILAPDGPLLTPAQPPLLYRLDAATGAEQARLEIAGRLCQGVAAGFGSLWACHDSGLTRIDPVTNAPVAEVSFQAPQAFARPVMGPDRVWALAGNVVATQVVEIDPTTNSVVASHDLGHVAGSLAYGAGAVWVTAPQDGLVLRLDAASGEVTQLTGGLQGPVAISFGAGSLWVGLYGRHDADPAAAGEPVIARLDPSDGSLQARIDIGSTSTTDGDIWATDDAVWVRTPADPFLLRISPATDEVVLAVAGYHSGGSLAVIGDALWTTSTEFQTVWRIDLANIGGDS